MNYKKIIAAFCLACLYLSAGAAINLPKVSIAGQEFYVYETRKGDSMYGIAKRYGWNIDRLMEMNPTLAKKMTKGAKVYFPVASDDATEVAAPVEFSAESYPVIQHVVKKGDSVYSIARMYDVPVETIYLYNPDSKYGVKRGSVITIPQEAATINDGDRFLYYAIRQGDSLQSIADTYNTSVEQLMRDNKGVSDNNFSTGDLLRISVNSNKDAMVTKEVDKTVLDHVETYKAGKDDTWESVAQKTGTDPEQLKSMNPDTEMKKNARIEVPVFETSHIVTEVVPTDDRLNMPGGLHDIYSDVHGLNNSDTAASEVRVALLIEDAQSKRDNEFTRGALLAIDRLKQSPYKIEFKIMQDRRSDTDSVAAVRTMTKDLDDFQPDLVVTTYEKNFPLWLANYGETNGIEIVNSFDVKSDLYLENPSIIHLLTPSAYFSEAVAEWEKETFGNYKLIMAGKKDPDDAFAEAIIAKSPGKVETLAVEALAEKKLTDWDRYLIYGYCTSRDDVAALLNAIATLKEENPLADVKVMGRLNWITYADAMKEQFAKADVYFPSRFFFDHVSAEGRKFISDYSAVFGHGPIRAFPTYAVAGYDITNYFVESLASNEGDFNEISPERNELQTPINLQRVGNWGGLFNPSAYIIHYPAYGDVEKILIRR